MYVGAQTAYFSGRIMDAQMHGRQEIDMTLGTLLLIVLILVLIGALPIWPYSSAWGYYPSGGLGLVVLILLILLLMGRI